MQQTAASQPFQKSFRRWKCGRLSLPHEMPWLFLCTDIFCSLSLLLLEGFLSACCILDHKFLSGFFPIQVKWGGGHTHTHTHTHTHAQTFLMCVRELGYIKKKDQDSSLTLFFKPGTRTHTPRGLPPIRTPWGFSRRAICLLGVATATISRPSCTSLFTCKWGRDLECWPSDGQERPTSCLMGARLYGLTIEQIEKCPILLYFLFERFISFRIELYPYTVSYCTLQIICMRFYGSVYY